MPEIRRATDRIFSGPQLHGDAAFSELAKLGVKTILSVDGAKPDLESAARHGLRYVHLPIGYDGIPSHRVAEFTKVAQTTPAPIYVHCHHGKHRGPAAVAMMCLATERWTAQQADEFLHAAGTSPEYPGLYRAAREFAMPSATTLAGISTNFPAVTETSTLVEAMVALDVQFDLLRSAEKADWRAPDAHPDRTPALHATLLWEQLRELARLPDTASRPESYRQFLAHSEAAAWQMRDSLRFAPRDTTAASVALTRLSQTCAKCHLRFRNE